VFLSSNTKDYAGETGILNTYLAFEFSAVNLESAANFGAAKHVFRVQAFKSGRGCEKSRRCQAS
jgi:hypothetical protein